MPLAGKESQREQEEVETLALKCCFSPTPIPSQAPRGGRLGVGAVGGLQRTDNPSHSLVGRGSGPLLAPSASATACAIRLASPAQQAGIPGRASPGPARGGSGLQSGGLPLCFIRPYLLFAFGALVFPSPEALTPSCASLWLSRPSLHLYHHLPGVSCQLWAQGASGPVSLSSCTLPPRPWLKAGGPNTWRGWLSAWLPWAQGLPPCPLTLLPLLPSPQ